MTALSLNLCFCKLFILGNLCTVEDLSVPNQQETHLWPFLLDLDADLNPITISPPPPSPPISNAACSTNATTTEKGRGILHRANKKEFKVLEQIACMCECILRFFNAYLSGSLSTSILESQ